MIFREEATSALAGFHAGDLYLGQIGILSVGFVEKGNLNWRTRRTTVARTIKANATRVWRRNRTWVT